MSANNTPTHHYCGCRIPRRRETRLLSFSFKLFERIETNDAACCSTIVCGGDNCTHICPAVDYTHIEQMIAAGIAASEAVTNSRIAELENRLKNQLLRIDDIDRAQTYHERRITWIERQVRDFMSVQAADSRPLWFLIGGAILGLIATVLGGASVVDGVFQTIAGTTWFPTKSMFWWIVYGGVVTTAFSLLGLGLGIALTYYRPRNGEQSQ